MNFFKLLIFIFIICITNYRCDSNNEIIEEIAGQTAINTLDAAKDKMVEKNMRFLETIVDIYIIENDRYPLSISELDLSNAVNPYSSSLPAFIDGQALHRGEVGYMCNGISYTITGFGNEGLISLKIIK